VANQQCRASQRAVWGVLAPQVAYLRVSPTTLAHEHTRAKLRAEMDVCDADGGASGQGDDREQRQNCPQERLGRLEPRRWLNFLSEQLQERPG
jgi:hypothetical protein